MKFKPPAWLTVKLAAFIGGALLIVVLFSVVLTQCHNGRNKAAQGRVEQSQAQAASDSAKDAINAVEASGEASRASEEQTRENSRDIHAAPGASERVNSGVNLAGRKALCKRAAYRDDPKCKVLR